MESKAGEFSGVGGGVAGGNENEGEIGSCENVGINRRDNTRIVLITLIISTTCCPSSYSAKKIATIASNTGKNEGYDQSSSAIGTTGVTAITVIATTNNGIGTINATATNNGNTMSKLYVGNLPSDCNESSLRQLFQVHNLSCTTILVKRGGYAFVDCSDQSTADRAIDKLNGEYLIPFF